MMSTFGQKLRNRNESTTFRAFYTSAPKLYQYNSYLLPTLKQVTFDLHPKAQIHCPKPNIKHQP